MAKSGRTEHLQIDGRDVPITNLDKVLYPENGFTKAQVIDYYIRVSEYLLPHFANRPVTLNRFPDGVNGESFYEKKAPKFAPSWIETFPVPRKTGGADIPYILINNLSTLVWCANVASLELHPFLHGVPDIQRPRSLIFDLDPGEGTDVVTCAEIAFLLKDALERLGLESWAKVSGSKGIQIYVPLNTAVTYAETRPFAKAVAELLTRQHPEQILPEMAKSQRAGKVFIDWSQNSDFKTTVGVYSLRAKRQRAFASLPVTWDELKTALTKGKADGLYWDAEAALGRLGKTGDLFRAVLTTKQKLPKGVDAAATTKRTPKRGETAPKLPASAMKFVEPMQCLLVDKLPEGDGWQYELKLDGYRALAIKEHGEVRLLSRRNNSLNTKFAAAAKALGTLEDGVMVDGEVVAPDAEGRPSFHLLQHMRKDQTLVFYAFDLLAHRGLDVRALPLSDRRKLLSSVIPQSEEGVRLSAVLNAEPGDLIRAVRAQKLEGLVAKRTDSKYEPGERSGRWVKYKVNQGQELVIGGYKPSGKGDFENLAVGYYAGGKLIFIAKIKNGFTPAMKAEIFLRLRDYETNSCPFANLPEAKSARRGEALTAEAMKKYRWLRPEAVAQIEFTDWTAADHLRHAKFIALRDDKNPREVTREAAREPD